MSSPFQFHPLLVLLQIHSRINFSALIAANTVVLLLQCPAPPPAVPHTAHRGRNEIYRGQRQEIATVNFELAPWRQHQARLGNDHHGQDGLEGQRHERIYAEN